MDRVKREKLLKLKVKIMKESGLTKEIVERNSEISRQIILSRDEDRDISIPRIIIS